jgi:hypothetical protein
MRPSPWRAKRPASACRATPTRRTTAIAETR